MPTNFHAAYVEYNEITRGQYFFNNPDCVKDVLNNQYWNSKSITTKTDSSGIPLYVWLAIGGGALVIVVAIVVYCMCCKGEEEDDTERTDP